MEPFACYWSRQCAAGSLPKTRGGRARLGVLVPWCELCHEVRPLRVRAGLCLIRLEKGNRSPEKERNERQQGLCDMVFCLVQTGDSVFTVVRGFLSLRCRWNWQAPSVVRGMVSTETMSA